MEPDSVNASGKAALLSLVLTEETKVLSSRKQYSSSSGFYAFERSLDNISIKRTSSRRPRLRGMPLPWSVFTVLWAYCCSDLVVGRSPSLCMAFASSANDEKACRRGNGASSLKVMSTNEEIKITAEMEIQSCFPSERRSHGSAPGSLHDNYSRGHWDITSRWPFSSWISTAFAGNRMRWLHRGGALSSTAASNHTVTAIDEELTDEVKARKVEHHQHEEEKRQRHPLMGSVEASRGLASTLTNVQSSSSSVHLQLTDPALTDNTNGDSKVDDKSKKCDSAPGTTTVTIHTYRDPTTNKTWKALNTAKRKFHAYLQYCGVLPSKATAAQIETVQQELVTASHQSIHGDAARREETDRLRAEWRILWKEGRLLTDRTELLAIYPSDKQQETSTMVQSGTNVNFSSKRKRGGFADLLHLYTDRLLAILLDEQEDAILAKQYPPAAKDTSGDEGSLTATGLVGWLETNYGKQETDALQCGNFRTLTEKEQLVKLKHFLEWFRSEFPYFYDRCGSCGASIKEDTATAAAAAPKIIDEVKKNVAEAKVEAIEAEKEETEHQTFVGYMYPDKSELQGKASRTELYQCHVCNDFTRFPRFNSATHVMTHRRGRCGEYSMLLYRFLRALQHESRWVVDWADHVWAEILLPGSNSTPRWVHLDPCEAAIDENFIYEDWGKKQTFIIGFYLPPTTSTQSAATTKSFSMIEDITQFYTRETWSDICKRREESEHEVKSSIEKAVHDLQSKLFQQHNTSD